MQPAHGHKVERAALYRVASCHTRRSSTKIVRTMSYTLTHTLFNSLPGTRTGRGRPAIACIEDLVENFRQLV